MAGASRRVLLLSGGAVSAADLEAFLEAASRLAEGLAKDESSMLVGLLADSEQVHEARSALKHFDNAMFVWGAPDPIPWQNGFFTEVQSAGARCWGDPQRLWKEVARVLAPGGVARLPVAAPAAGDELEVVEGGGGAEEEGIVTVRKRGA